MSERRDAAGRPVDEHGRAAVEDLTDAELEEEISVAAMTHREERDERYEALLSERERRFGTPGR